MTIKRLKPLYQLSELATAMSVSKRSVRRLLRLAKVPTEKLGGTVVVYASDLEVRLPKLWASLVACDAATSVRRDMED